MSTESMQVLPDILRGTAKSYPDYPALSFVDAPAVTYRDVDDTSRRLGAGLTKLRTKPGTHVAILGENMPNWGIAYMAIARVGGVIVPVLPDFSASEVSNILDHAETPLLFVSARQYPKVADLVARGKIAAILLDSFEIVPKKFPGGTPEELKALSGQSAVSGAGETPDDSASGASDVSRPHTDVSREPTDLAAIIYTSGTTGNSKGVMLTHENIVSNVLAAKQIPDIESGQSMLSLLPLAHTYECTLGLLVPLSAGACVYYLSKPPSPSVLMPALARIRPHLMLSVPLFIEKIFRGRVLPKFTESRVLRLLYRVRPIQKLLHKAGGRKVYALFGGRLHFFGIGGAPLAPDVERFLRDAGFPYAVGYGLTETAPLVAGSGPTTTVFQSIGPVLDKVRVRLSDESEVQVKGPNVMLGYYKNDRQTAEVFTEDGWFRTGDIGSLTSDGILSIRGRIKNMILGPSGENIYPEQIEAVINEKEYVEESLVMQAGGKLVSLVYLNYEALLNNIASARADVKDWHAAVQSNVEDQTEQVKIAVEQFREDIDSYLQECRQKINSELNTFSKISELVLRLEPFEKTPTMKIKRYLYTK